jgi:hypothetical protein
LPPALLSILFFYVDTCFQRWTPTCKYYSVFCICHSTEGWSFLMSFSFL